MSEPRTPDMQTQAVLAGLAHYVTDEELALAAAVLESRRIEVQDIQSKRSLAGLDQLDSAIQIAEAVVRVLIPEFRHVELDAPGDVSLSIGRQVVGVDWRDLTEGDRLVCVFEGKFATRVLYAKLLSRSPS